MPKICYVVRDFTPSSEQVIAQAIEILDDYSGQGFVLTLRQLYYQFVARGLLENTVKNYKRLGSIINDARLAGLIDWEAIEDRTRGISSTPHWDTPADIIDSAAASFRIDKWSDQKYRVEVWIEKDALSGVFSEVCRKLDIAQLSCRGYTSQSEMWRGAMRLKRYIKNGQTPVILHFGDHDPSGIDMSRDIEDRLKMFGANVIFERLALNFDQVKQYNPPPNPAKETDSRCAGYVRQFGHESWELDALEPKVLVRLASQSVLRYREEGKWSAAISMEQLHRDQLNNVSERWDSVVEFLGES